MDAARKNVGRVTAHKPGGVKRMNALSLKKKTPLLRGFADCLLTSLIRLPSWQLFRVSLLLKCASCATSMGSRLATARHSA